MRLGWLGPVGYQGGGSHFSAVLGSPPNEYLRGGPIECPQRLSLGGSKKGGAPKIWLEYDMSVSQGRGTSKMGGFPWVSLCSSPRRGSLEEQTSLV